MFPLFRFYIIIFLITISCENKSFISEDILNIDELSVVSSNEMKFSTYQITPSIGNNEIISVGNKGLFKNLTTFIEFKDYQSFQLL